MQPLDGVGSVLGHDDGLIVDTVPVGGLFDYVICDLRRLARVRIPSVVAIEANHVQVTTLNTRKLFQYKNI